MAFQKIHGISNPADLFTKHLSRECIDKYIDMLGAVKTEGRSEKAAQLHHLQKKLRQLRSQVKRKDMKTRTDVAPALEDKTDEISFVKYVVKMEGDMNFELEDKFRQWRKQECRKEGSSRAVTLKGSQ